MVSVGWGAAHESCEADGRSLVVSILGEVYVYWAETLAGLKRNSRGAEWFRGDAIN